MTARKQFSKKVLQVSWSDVQPWADQLVEEYGVHVKFHVAVPWSAAGIKPGVTMLAYRCEGRGEPEVVQEDWQVFNPLHVGGAEAAALQLCSKLLLTLSQEVARAEQQASFF